MCGQLSLVDFVLEAADEHVPLLAASLAGLQLFGELGDGGFEVEDVFLG
jgi:hypothetical protein